MTPVWPIRGGRGVKLTGYLDSPHMLSQYLLIYSEAIKTTIKEIKAKTQNRLFYDPSLTLLHILDTILVHCILHILGTILVHCLI